MTKFHTSASAGAILALLLVCLAFDQANAAPPAGAETPKQSAPQGEDPPGAEDNGQAPQAQHDGVITPPQTGDEGIHTDVPNPNAGPGDEIVPPSQLPGGENANPK